jgi:hypothetical protein
MGRVTFLLCLMCLVAACDGKESFPRLPESPTVPQPVPAPPSPPPPSTPTPITLGQEVKSKFAGRDVAFELTAPAGGMLVARLTWDVWLHGSLLVLTVGDMQVKPVDPEWSPVIARIPVAAGQTYRLTITGGGTDWYYDEAFVLTTAIE